MPAISYGNANDLLPIKMMLDTDTSLKTADIEKIFTTNDIPMEIIGDGNVYIPYTSICAVYETAARVLEDSSFGLNCGLKWGIESIGPFGEYATSAANLKQCLERLIEAIGLYEGASFGSLIIHDKHVKFLYLPGCLKPVGARHFTDANIGLMIDFFRFYLGPDWLPVRIGTIHPEAHRSISMKELYGVPIDYGQKGLTLTFQAKELAAPRPDKLFLRRIDTLSELELIMNNLPPNSIAQAVTEVIRLRLLGGLVDIKGAALNMKLSTRSLQRRLAKEGENYRDILGRERFTRARALLSETDATITQIARLLGYEYSADFTRAFTKQNDTSPIAYRKSKHIKLN